MTKIFTAADVAKLVSMDDCIDAVERVFRDFAEGRLAKSHSLGVHAGEGTFHVKVAAADVLVAKLNANFPLNPERHNLPSIQGVIIVMDLTHGTPLAVIDSTWITTMRTAAATAVAAKHLARRDAKTLAIIGCGVQGVASIEAISRVREIERVKAFDVNADAVRRAGLDAASSIDEALDGADIVVTCTPSRAPILEARHASEGLFIAAVGADNPQKQEIAPELLKKAKVVADVLDQSATMGDLQHAIAAGVMTREDAYGELGDVVSGRIPGRRSDDEFFIFDSTGTALQDVAVASLVLGRASHVGVDVAFRSL